MKLHIQQIVDTNDSHFLNAMRIYMDSFPDNERQPLPIIKTRIETGKSMLYVGLINEEVVCMALLWNFVDLHFVLLDYMAVMEKYRNNKFGAALFQFLSHSINSHNKYMVIEVENYLFGHNREQRKRRINFYVRNGAYLLNDTPYMLPSLDGTTPTEMLLMISPKYKKDYISNLELKNLITRLFIELYGKLENDFLLTSILGKIPDKITFKNNIIV